MRVFRLRFLFDLPLNFISAFNLPAKNGKNRPDGGRMVDWIPAEEIPFKLIESTCGRFHSTLTNIPVAGKNVSCP